MRGHRVDNAPRSLRRSAVHLDNVVLAPASLLPFKAEWQEIANELPNGSVLIVTPLSDRPRRSILEQIRSHLLAHGRYVRTLPAEHLTARAV